MATRRDSRERTVQFLYHWEMNPQESLEVAFKKFWRQNTAASAARAYAETLVRGVLQNLSVIDEMIRKYAENWDLERMAAVDRNIIRLALYEMMFLADIPPSVSINEAVDLAKYYSSRNSGKFVNGLLDQLRKSLPQPDPQSEQGPGA